MEVLTPLKSETEDFSQEKVLRESRSRAPQKLSSDTRFIRNSMYFLLAFMPLCFGGVHSTIYYPSICLVSLTTAWIFYKHSKIIFSVSKESHYFSNYVRAVFLGLISFSILQRLIFIMFQESHKVLGSAPMYGQGDNFLVALIGIYFAWGLFEVFTFLFHSIKHQSRKLSSFLVGIGFIVSLVALSHWFYDNGRLFWYFEPDNIFVSNRARWPFVNSNSLGQFLLLPIFLSLSKMFQVYRKLFKESGRNSTNGSRAGKRLFVGFSRNSQRYFAVGFIYLCAFLSLTLALLGSISRGAFFGFLVGLVGFMFFYYKQKVKKPKLYTAPQAKKEVPHHRNRRLSSRERENQRIRYYTDRVKEVFSKWIPVFLVALIVLTLIGFLQGEGSQRLEGRIEYGLISTLEDTRWQMYSDNLSILADKPILGVGLGNWDRVYPEYMNPKLSGMNPGYLHSDPLQTLVELGLLFGGIFILSGCFFLYKSFNILLSRSNRSKHLAIASFCGLAAVLVASLVDFPFRIPAISLVFILGLSIFCYEVDLIYGSKERN